MEKCHSMNVFQDQEKLRQFVRGCDRSLGRDMENIARQIAGSETLHLLGLTGPTCSGKTTAANKLTEYFQAHGYRVHVISIDDFYYDKDYLHARAEQDPDIEIDYDSEDTIDIELLHEKTKSLLSCKPTQMPRFDFRTGKRTEGKCIKPTPKDIFLFEGIQLLYPKVLSILEGSAFCNIYICPLSSISVGGEIFAPNELRLMRRLVRDYRYRSSEPAFTLYLWQSVRANEDRNIFPNAHNCCYVIDSTMPYEVGMLKPYLETILPRVTDDSPFYPEAQNILRKIQSVQSVPSDYMADHSLYKEFI